MHCTSYCDTLHISGLQVIVLSDEVLTNKVNQPRLYVLASKLNSQLDVPLYRLEPLFNV